MAWRISGESFSHLEVSEDSTRRVWLVAFAGWVWTHWASVVGVAIPGGVFMVSIVWGGVVGLQIEGCYGGAFVVSRGGGFYGLRWGCFQDHFSANFGVFWGWFFGLVFEVWGQDFWGNLKKVIHRLWIKLSTGLGVQVSFRVECWRINFYLSNAKII